MAKGTPGFFDVDERLAELSAKGDDLERVKALVDFDIFRAALEAAAPPAIPLSFTAWTGSPRPQPRRPGGIVQGLTGRGVRVEFVKEGLTFTGEDSPMAGLMLSVMGAFAEFERALMRERQREGIALARQRGAYRGRKKSLPPENADELRRRAKAGEKKLHLAREFGISRESKWRRSQFRLRA